MLSAAPQALRKPATLGGTLPSPVGGLNARDGLAEMKSSDAVILENWFCEASYCRIRNGFSDHASGISGDVQTVMEWAGPAGRKFFAANASAIYEVTSAGAVGAADVSGLSTGYWQHVNFTTSGGAFLVIANGSDSVRNYDGSSWSTPAITNVTSANLKYVTSHKKRLWFVEKETTKAWYLPVESIAGAATAFQLGSVFQKGGYLRLIGTVSRDAGSGPDDFLCFISSRGEVAVYQGTDPSSANTWALVSRFLVGAPIGDRALFNTGGDLAMISEDGIVSLTEMMGTDRAAASRASITDKIDDLFSDAFQSYGTNAGWQALIYPRGHMAIINVPTSDTVAIQYVMNTQTGAWCKFTGMNARCWGLFGEDVYFGGSGGVWQADDGASDDGNDIPGDMATAWSYVAGRNVRKRFTMIRPLFESNGPMTLAVRLNTDYRHETPDLSDAFDSDENAGSLWGTMVWGTGYWNGPTIRNDWYATFGDGYAASVRLRTLTNGETVKLHAFDVKAERQSEVAL